jgi:hypothetical protein
MSIVLNGSTGITDADGGTVLNTNDLASQAQAETGTDNATLMTPLRTAQAITAQIKPALNASGSAPIYACRAWVNFNGAGTVAIRTGGNVSSITDNGTGDYTVNLTTAMQDANYACVGSCGFDGVSPAGADNVAIFPSVRTASSIRVRSLQTTNNTYEDTDVMNVVFFR